MCPGRGKLTGNREGHNAGTRLICKGKAASRPARYVSVYSLSIRRRIDFGPFSKLDLRMARTPINDALRRAIRDCGISASELERRTGVPQPTITRFQAGADMKLSTADRMAEYLGLALVKKA